MLKSKQSKLLERRLNQLEQQNAALVAENAEQRQQLKSLHLQMGRDDMAIETGRRISTFVLTVPSRDGFIKLYFTESLLWTIRV